MVLGSLGRRSLSVQAPNHKRKGDDNPPGKRCRNTYPKGYREEDGAEILSPSPSSPHKIMNERTEQMKKEYAFVAVLDFTGKQIAIFFPDLEEALSQADSVEEALRRANEVLKLTIESRIMDSEDIPEATPLDKVGLQEGQRTIVATCTLNEKIKYDKKTLTIPHDLNVAAEAAGINFSQVLQTALREKLAEVE